MHLLSDNYKYKINLIFEIGYNITNEAGICE